MGGFRALCCSKSDRKSDDQPTPSKPSTQPQPEKQTQKAPASVKADTSSTDVTREKPGPRDLWKEAYEGLDPGCKKYVSRDDSSATDAINGVIEQTTARYEEWRKGGLRIPRKDGDEINLRDSAEKIISAAMKAKNLISTFVSFDPTGHASSAWTIVQNTLDRRDAIFTASGYLAETLAYYALIDANYRNQGVGSDHNLDQALLQVYSAILLFSAEVKKAQDENAASRAAQSVFALTEQPLSQLKEAINKQSAVAEKWASLAANLGDRKVAAAHLATIKSVESKVLTAEEESQIAWVSTAPFSSRQRELQKKRTRYTGNWLLESKDYLEWKYNPGSLLWLPGISGCGKSVLCSTVIRDIEEECQSDDAKYLAYWYFQFGDEKTQSVDSMTRSLIRQLSRSPLLPSVIKIWNEHHLKGSQPDSQAISILLDDVVSSIPGNVYLIFDALDECPVNAYSKERRSLLSLLTGLLERHRNKIHILATSRAEQDIKEELEVFSKIDLEARLADDVKSFVKTSIAEAPLKKFNENIKGLIQEKLLSSKERRFRWAELQIAEIEKCHREKDVVAALNAIPQTLEASYLKILNALGPRDAPLARDILMAICTSSIALDLEAVAAIVGLDFPESILEICTTSLVSEFDGIIRVAHFSVQEFLIVDENNEHHHDCQFSTMDGHRFLATRTVDCLLEQQTVHLSRKELDEVPFFKYAAKHWHTHMALLTDSDPARSGLQAKIDRLFTEHNIYINWAPYWVDELYFWNEKDMGLVEKCQRPIQMASKLGLAQTVEELMNQGADADDVNRGNGQRALQVASHQGHGKTVQILLDRGADINTASGPFSLTPLQEASIEGHEDIARMLLDRGADVNLGGQGYGSALGAAAAKGHETITELLLDQGANVITQQALDGALQSASSHGHGNIVQMLLDHGADIEAQKGGLGSPLILAAGEGDEKTVHILLDGGANVHARPREFGHTALHFASLCGNENIVQILLDRGADVNAQKGKSHRTALHYASSEGHERVVQVLLDYGADLNMPGGKPVLPALSHAIANGHGKIVQMLLGRGADINAPGIEGVTPLAIALEVGLEDIMNILLDHGAVPNALEGEYSKPLITAAGDGDEGIVRILLDRGADVNAHDPDEPTALESAMIEGHENIVQLLLDYGADVNAHDPAEEEIALQFAARGGHANIVRLLLDHGADVNVQGAVSCPLRLAAMGSHEETVQILLDRGANVNARKGESAGTALHSASAKGHEGIVRMLLDHGADPSMQGGKIVLPALTHAVFSRRKAVVELLLDRGVDINAPGANGLTALACASDKGWEDILEILLEHGANVNANGESGNALYQAASKGHEKIVQILLDRGANVDLRGGDLGTAVQGASSNGHEGIVRLLLDRGAEPIAT
ncbi:hypothetical protein FE257_000970 [Aspergillus nanangensis]|uniref:Nephrocystin 3-like N-terminal domain-containing protein n=1 Tax=Aspergillus nanangensis TaxID=2582783 RepID=A0AAD4CUA3_ASPNN|nr:hypothetical protein FE257_000970 [Aspergillus nanangensis]